VTDINADAWVSSSHRRWVFAEFVIVIASIMAAESAGDGHDACRRCRRIASAFHIDVANRPQAVLSTFLIGFASASSRWDRCPTASAAVRAARRHGGVLHRELARIAAQSFETLLLARGAAGLGTSATRVIATSIVRDCYAGRRMASVMSLR